MKRNKASAFDPGFSSSSLPAAPRRVVWLLSVLTLGTAGMVLWIVREAIRSEQLAARQRWNEAAQIRLTDARQRLENFFSSRRVALLQLSDQAPSQIFAAAVRDGIADSLLCPAAAGQEAYPQAFLPPPAGLDSPDPVGISPVSVKPEEWENRARQAGKQSPALPPAEIAQAWLAAQQAWLNALRNNAGAPELAAALRIAEEFFSQPAQRLLTGPDGRRLAAAADLRLLQEFHRFGRKPPPPVSSRLRRELADYSAPALPAPQRRFLMTALAVLENQPPASLFDTFAAETLAALYQLSPNSPERATALRLTENGPILLFETGHLQNLLIRQAESPVLRILPPAKDQLTDTGPGTAELEIHPALPGWRLAMVRSPQDSPSRRIAFYLWTGGAFVLLLGGLTLLTWRQVQSQLRRARLRHDLAATVSHELRTPVASMRVLVDSLREDHPLDETKTREYLALLSSENHRLSQLIDNILTLARLDKNRLSGAEPGLSVSLRDLFEHCAASAAAAGQGDRLRFRFPQRDSGNHASPESETGPQTQIAADPTLLETALLNLIDNACKFSPPGSPVLCEAQLETRENQQPILRLSVHDQGPGLSPAEQKRIWQPFERLPVHHHSHRGCGLGLAIVQRAISLSGGQVEITSAPGQGSTFHIFLPLRAAPTLSQPS